jgi:hypothetical protein
MFENGNRPQAVIMVAGVVELDMSRKSGTAHQLPPKSGRFGQRKSQTSASCDRGSG